MKTRVDGRAGQNALYRCSNDGQTRYFERGEIFQPCSCGKGCWLLYPEDTPNVLPGYFRTLTIKQSGNVIEVHESVDVGICLNISGDSVLKDGLYCVEVIHSRGDSDLLYLIPLGPFDPEFFAYRV